MFCFGIHFQKSEKSAEEFCVFEDNLLSKRFFAHNDFEIQRVPTEYRQNTHLFAPNLLWKDLWKFLYFFLFPKFWNFFSNDYGNHRILYSRTLSEQLEEMLFNFSVPDKGNKINISLSNINSKWQKARWMISISVYSAKITFKYE